MKHVSILIPQGHFSLVNVEGTHQVLLWVNEYLQQTDRMPLFKVELVGLSKVTTQTNGLFTINPDVLITDVEKTDLIILPAVHGDLETNLKQNKGLLEWIVKQYKNGAEVVSYCIGSFMLAATGLLNGRPCSTHWRSAHEFRKLFPEVNLMDEKIMTEADGIYTSGGAYSFTNLLMYLIEKYAGRDLAITAAKTFMIDIDRSSQSPFIMFAGQKAHQDEIVLNAQEYIEQYYSDKITVDELSESQSVMHTAVQMY